MKEDILEQIVDDYLQFQGYFTTHNVRFKPDPAHLDYVADLDRVPSDVDVVALHQPIQVPTEFSSCPASRGRRIQSSKETH